MNRITTIVVKSNIDNQNGINTDHKNDHAESKSKSTKRNYITKNSSSSSSNS